MVKNPPAMQETPVLFLSWEDPWRRERLPTPVFWPGEFRGLYSPWSHKELDMTEQISLSLFKIKNETELLLPFLLKLVLEVLAREISQ